MTDVRRFLRWLFKPVIALVALFFVFEEWLWDQLTAAMRRLADHAWVHALEAWLRKIPPWASLLVLLLPGLVILPFKVAGLWAIAQGYPVLGLLIFIAAKLAGTAVAAYLFDLVRDNARKLVWFDRLYVWVIAGLQRARAWLHAQPVYQAVRAWVRQMRAQVRTWLGRDKP